MKDEKSKEKSYRAMLKSTQFVFYEVSIISC